VTKCVYGGSGNAGGNDGAGGGNDGGGSGGGECKITCAGCAALFVI
jgi:hypothetical protein